MENQDAISGDHIRPSICELISHFLIPLFSIDTLYLHTLVKGMVACCLAKANSVEFHNHKISANLHNLRFAVTNELMFST